MNDPPETRRTAGGASRAARREDARRRGRAIFPVLLAALAILILRRATPLGELLAALPVVGRAIPFFLLAVGTLAWRLRRGDEPADFGLRAPRSWLRALALGAAGAALAIFVPLLLETALDLLGLDPPHVPALRLLEGRPELLVTLLPLMWIFAAFGEELLHRGFILTRLAWLWGDTPAAWRRAVLVQALFFGIGHAYQGLGGVVTSAASALIYALVFLAAGRSLWAPVVAHGAKNTASFVIGYLR